MRCFQPLLLLGLFSYESNAEVPLYSCPKPGNDPVEVSVPAKKKKKFRIRLRKSKKKVLCILAHVSTNSDEVNINQLSFTSRNEDFTLVPIARSYAASKWEMAAGIYTQEKQFKVRKKCPKKKCKLTIPILPNAKKGKFVLMSFRHSSSETEQLSRFLSQATFGPTKKILSNLQGWDFSGGFNSGLAKWTKDQMNLNKTPMTSHREFYRTRHDSGMREQVVVYSNLTPQHPCDRYSRWARYAFSGDDVNREFYVTTYGNRYLVTVEGIPRTIINTWQDNKDENLAIGRWLFCYYIEENSGGTVLIRPDSTSACVAIKDGNPILDMQGLTSPSINYLSLPSSLSFQSIQPILLPERQESYGGESLKLLSNLFPSNPQQCNNFQRGNYTNTFGIFSNGGYARYLGFAKLEENTMQNPVPDGGLQAKVDLSYYCHNVPTTFQNIESCKLSQVASCTNTHDRYIATSEDRIVLCGSPNEVANDRNYNEPNTFRNVGSSNNQFGNWNLMKKNVWNMIALEEENDQLRQRVAWALSQILVVTPNQIMADNMVEPYLNYYDIFVRHAFGNYRDILKEVSYSPMMAEMLSYLESKSTAYVLMKEGTKAYPDENYAREIMQLFTIGINKLRADGRPVLDDNGDFKQTYDNSDIQTFARAWTGFYHQNRRGNYEGYRWSSNQIDPLRVNGLWRDPFPKMDLNSDFIGDAYPLCVDFPSKQFLRKGAAYRLLGSFPLPTEQYEPSYWWNRDLDRTVLDTTGSSDLFNDLCGSSAIGGPCNFKPLIELTSNIGCHGVECNLDNVKLVQVQDSPRVYYEYVRPPCVELAFYNNAQKIASRQSGSRDEEAMCANKELDTAMDACCNRPDDDGPTARTYCLFTAERMTFSTAEARCKAYSDSNSRTCDYKNVYQGVIKPDPDEEKCSYQGMDRGIDWHWTDKSCQILVKVAESGMIAVVHSPDLKSNDDRREIFISVHPDNTNYFKVQWDGANYPKPSNQCLGTCQQVIDACLCNMQVLEESVFASVPSAEDVLDQLKIGHAHPDRYDAGSYAKFNENDSVAVYRKSGGADFDQETLFRITHNGKETFFKNSRSTVFISNNGGSRSDYRFRNPPHFLSFALLENRDAKYETEAVLDHYFYHPNTAPFIATRLIQRFGVSNPSPRYIKTVSKAFKTGSFESSGVTFGDGEYGNLAATIAAILMNREARNPLLDADPIGGSLKEPMLKLIAYMRAMEFEKRDVAPEIKLMDLQERIGQMPHSVPNVFSFFLPDFSPKGPIKDALLYAPEAQILVTPQIISYLNGIFSLVDLGLSDCYGGFGERTVWNCRTYYNDGVEKSDYSRGVLSYSPSSSVASQVVDELALLLTDGRLSATSRNIMIDAYNSANNRAASLRVVQKLIVTTPEYHSTGLFTALDEIRPEIEDPIPSDREYRAVVYLYLAGGLDSFNMLVPHSNCNGGRDLYQQYVDVRGEIALLKNSLHQIDASSSSQPCSTYGIHNFLPAVRDLYNDNDLLFMANVGTLQQYVNKDNWRTKSSKTALFAHNVQAEEAANVDIYDQKAGRGILGRIIDVLKKRGFTTGSLSVNGNAAALVSQSSPLFVVSPYGVERFNPNPEDDDDANADLRSSIKGINKKSTISTSFFGETWSDSLFRSLDEIDLLYDQMVIQNTTIDFGRTYLNRQFETISKLMKTRDARGTDRDVFYAAAGGYDTHSDIAPNLETRFTELNSGLDNFAAEMKAQNLWDNVTVFVVSEFSRTLLQNSGNGSDHAWGGHYFAMGGSVTGGRIIGDYPDDITNDGPNAFSPGVVIPSTAWETPWNSIAQWLGISRSSDLDQILPNRETFKNDLWSANDMFCDDLDGLTVGSNADQNCGWVRDNLSASLCNQDANFLDGKPMKVRDYCRKSCGACSK